MSEKTPMANYFEISGTVFLLTLYSARFAGDPARASLETLLPLIPAKVF